jgi:hypothetical protein
VLGEDPAFPVWQACEPILQRFENTAELREHLRWAATRRQVDAALSAICRLHVAERWSVPGELLAEAFSDEVCRVLDGLELRRKPDPDRTDWLAVSETALQTVARESVIVGEEQSGRMLMSRTWARTFRVIQKTDSAILGEAEALMARVTLAVRDHWQALRGRRVLDRLAGRIADPSEAFRAAKDADRTGRSFDRLCRERGLSLYVARLQVRECREKAALRRTALWLMTLELDTAHLELIREEDGDFGDNEDFADEFYDEEDEW